MPKAKNAKADEALALYRQGHKLVEIARQLDLPEGTVRRWKCTYKWDDDKANARNDTKANARNKGGAPKGNKNAAGNSGGGAPKGNQNAKRWGLLSRYIPQETMDILGITAETSPLDLLWDQIQIAYAAIIRAQQIAYAAIIRAQQISFVKDQDDKTIEKIEDRSGSESWGEKWEVQQAWDKQASFMKAQARAQSELRSMIKQYDEMLHKDWETATEEQKARLKVLQSKLNDGAGQEDPVVIINDTQRSPDQ